MSETPESIKARFELSMFMTNDSYMRNQITLEQCQSRLLGLQKAMESEIERCKNIEKVHAKKKIGESPFE